MSHDASGDERLPHADDLHPDVAALMIARAFAGAYRDVFEAPVPEPLVATLRQMESGLNGIGADPFEVGP
jgi:hypothetical protein